MGQKPHANDARATGVEDVSQKRLKVAGPSIQKVDQRRILADRKTAVSRQVASGLELGGGAVGDQMAQSLLDIFECDGGSLGWGGSPTFGKSKKTWKKTQKGYGPNPCFHCTPLPALIVDMEKSELSATGHVANKYAPTGILSEEQDAAAVDQSSR